MLYSSLICFKTSPRLSTSQQSKCKSKEKEKKTHTQSKSPYNANASNTSHPSYNKITQTHKDSTTVKSRRTSPGIPKRIPPSTHHPPRGIAPTAQPTPTPVPHNLRRSTAHPRRPSRMHTRRIRVHIARNTSNAAHRAGAADVRSSHSASRYRRQRSSGESRVVA
jgi:hypothetical protein